MCITICLCNSSLTRLQGSRQNRSVPSEKGLALRVGPRSPWKEPGQLGRTAAHAADCPGSLVGVHGMQLVAFLSAMNNQLRTGADKGNPTVSKCKCKCKCSGLI